MNICFYRTQNHVLTSDSQLLISFSNQEGEGTVVFMSSSVPDEVRPYSCEVWCTESVSIWTLESLISVCKLCMAYRVLAHFSKRRQLCVHDLFSVEVLFRIRGPCVSSISRLPTYFLNKHALKTTATFSVHYTESSKSYYMNKLMKVNVPTEEMWHAFVSACVAKMQKHDKIICFPCFYLKTLTHLDEFRFLWGYY